MFVGPVVRKKVWFGMRHALLTTDPLAGLALVVVTVEGEQITMWAERSALRIIAAFQTSERVFVTLVVADTDGTQGVEMVVDKAQNLVKAFTRIAEHL